MVLAILNYSRPANAESTEASKAVSQDIEASAVADAVADLQSVAVKPLSQTYDAAPRKGSCGSRFSCLSTWKRWGLGTVALTAAVLAYLQPPFLFMGRRQFHESCGTY